MAARNKLKITVGADPELFVKEKHSDRFVGAHTFLPGTKLEPFKVPFGAVQVDGMAAEFNIDPAETASQFVHNVGAVFNNLNLRASQANLELVVQPTVEFEPSYFDTLPDAVKELGCNPDFNAWTGQVNETPDRRERPTLCAAAGHVHIGWHKKPVNPLDKFHFMDCCAVVKQLDYFLGMPSLMWDEDSLRRSLYGKAGSFRPKPYGVEYRTLSNVWLRSTTIQKWIFEAASEAVNQLSKTSMEDRYQDYARTTIDGNKKWWMEATGKKIFSTTGLAYPDYNSTKKPVVTPPQEQEKKERFGLIWDEKMERWLQPDGVKANPFSKMKTNNKKAFHHYDQG